MYDLVKIENRCKEISASVGDVFDIPVSINGRLTRTLGRVHQEKIDGETWISTKMEFSRSFLETSTDETVESVIAHEWAHYYVTKITGESHGHDAHFKRVCALIGCENDGVATKVERTVEAKSRYKYVVHCHTCNEDIGFYTRMCGTLKNLNLCTCKRCGGSNLSYTQNW